MGRPSGNATPHLPAPPDDLRAEGTEWGRALLDRVERGASSPQDLATVLIVLESGPMLDGACAVIYDALSAALKHGQRP